MDVIREASCVVNVNNMICRYIRDRVQPLYDSMYVRNITIAYLELEIPVQINCEKFNRIIYTITDLMPTR